MSTIEKIGSEFAEYDGFTIEYRDSSHRYWGEVHTACPELGIKVGRKPWTSVTSALSIIDKPGLRRWYGNQDSYAVLDAERNGELTGIPTDQAIYIVRQRGFGAEAQRDTGADRGKALHEALRVYCAEGKVPALGDFSEAVRGYVQGLCGWLVETGPEPLLIERIIGSPLHSFAGRFDLLADIDGVRTLVDLKTSAKIWPEHHLQLAGYRIAMAECGIEPPERSLILAASETGHFQTAECQADDQDFLAVLNCHRALGALRSLIRKDDRG